MAELLEKCAVCQALLDEEDLFCGNCGTEAPDRTNRAEAEALQSTHNFECSGCGASMSYDASARNLRCPFCGSERLEERQDAKMLSPNRVVPFAVNRESAEQILRRWMGSGFWRPGDLARASSIQSMAPVYVPYWVFQADTFTHWTADSSQVPMGARGNWCPVYGTHRGHYDGLLIGASGALTPGETLAICPFDLASGVPPEKVDLQNAVFEQFRVPRKFARPLAQQGLEDMERVACQSLVPGSSRNLKVNVRMQGLVSEPVLLPVWIMAYSYQNKVFRFLVNGQSGQATGTAPTDWTKVGWVAAIVIGAILVIVLLATLCSGIASRRASRKDGDSAILAPSEQIATRREVGATELPLRQWHANRL